MDWISESYRGGYHGKGRRKVAPPVAPTGPTFVNVSVPGDDVQKLDARINADLIVPSSQMSPAPTIVLIATAVNLILLDPAEFTLRYNSILNKLVVGIPGVQIACATIFCYGEAVPSPDDAALATKNGLIVTAAAAVGATVINTRGPQQAYEIANNTTNKTQDVLTVDGLHPNPIGCRLISDTGKKYFTLVGP